jgi:hypothetical protein
VPYYPLGVAADMSLVSIGGCVISEEMATWTCLSCRHDWEGPDSSRAIREAIRKVHEERASP